MPYILGVLGIELLHAPMSSGQAVYWVGYVGSGVVRAIGCENVDVRHFAIESSTPIRNLPAKIIWKYYKFPEHAPATHALQDESHDFRGQDPKGITRHCPGFSYRRAMRFSLLEMRNIHHRRLYPPVLCAPATRLPSR